MEVGGKEMTWSISIPIGIGKEMSLGSQQSNLSIGARDGMYRKSFEEGLEKRRNLVHIIVTFLLNIL